MEIYDKTFFDKNGPCSTLKKKHDSVRFQPKSPLHQSVIQNVFFLSFFWGAAGVALALSHRRTPAGGKKKVKASVAKESLENERKSRRILHPFHHDHQHFRFVFPSSSGRHIMKTHRIKLTPLAHLYRVSTNLTRLSNKTLLPAQRYTK